MTLGALLFFAVSWTFVLGTMVWSFARILKAQAARDAAPGERPPVS